MGKVALIVGISGQDGAYLANLLLSKGYSVFGASRDAQASSFNNLRTLGIIDSVVTLSSSPGDFHSVLCTLKKVNPTEVYNLSGQSSVGLSFEQPMETFRSVAIANLVWLEAIRFTGENIKYYNAGSSECFGNTEKPADEKTPFNPRSPYAVAKAAAFWQVVNYRESYNLHASSGILYNHESPLRPERFVTQKIVRAACRIALGSPETLQLGNINVTRDWGWAPEYVEAMWSILQNDSPGDYVVATGYSCTLRDFVEYVFSALSLDWEKHVQINDAFMRPSDIVISRGCADKASRELKWKAHYTAPDVARFLVEAESKRLHSVSGA